MLLCPTDHTLFMDVQCPITCTILTQGTNMSEYSCKADYWEPKYTYESVISEECKGVTALIARYSSTYIIYPFSF